MEGGLEKRDHSRSVRFQSMVENNRTERES